MGLADTDIKIAKVNIINMLHYLMETVSIIRKEIKTIKNDHVCVANDTINKEERQSMEWEYICKSSI